MTEEKSEPQYVQIQIVKNERTYRFLIPVGASIDDAIEASADVTKEIVFILRKSLSAREEEKTKE